MPPPKEAVRLVAQDVALEVATATKTTAAAATLIAAPGTGRKIRVRAYVVSSAGTEVTTARIRATRGGTDTIIYHQSTDDQIGCVMVLPGYVDGDENTAVTIELSVASTNGILYTVYYEIVQASA